jgi:adenosine deaminase
MKERVTASLNTYRALPKVELHRHLEGSLRLDTMLDIARQHGITIPEDVLRLSTLVQVQEEDKFTFQNFLAKFNTLRLFYRSPDVIHRITREAIEDAAKDNVKYLELRFTPVALSRAERFPLHDVIDWVMSSAEEASKIHNVVVRLIASVNRHESPDLAEQVAWLAAEHIKGGMVALDLAGNEAEYPSQPFYGIFKEAKQAGLHVTIHAGEWGPASHIKEAIEVIEAERIGHGVRVLEDANVTALAKERGTAFEVCVTSNYQSGVVESRILHCLRGIDDAAEHTEGTHCCRRTGRFPAGEREGEADETHAKGSEVVSCTTRIPGDIKGALLPPRTGVSTMLAARRVYLS